MHMSANVQLQVKTKTNLTQANSPVWITHACTTDTINFIAVVILFVENVFVTIVSKPGSS